MSNPITINTEEAIAKLIAFIKVRAKARFNIEPELIDEVLSTLWKLAKESGITIQIIDPNNNRIAVLGASGAIIGASIGYAIGSIPGAIVGAVTGGVTGCVMSHVTLKMQSPVIGQSNFVALDLI